MENTDIYRPNNILKNEESVIEEIKKEIKFLEMKMTTQHMKFTGYFKSNLRGKFIAINAYTNK